MGGAEGPPDEPEPEPDAGSGGGEPTGGGDSGETCSADDECPAIAPQCVEGSCTACGDSGGDALCEARDPARPVCAATGRCVACDPDGEGLCPADAPYCADDFTCGGCTRHADCGDDAGCDLAAAECLRADRVWWVDADRCVSTGGYGTQDDPYCRLEDAVANAVGTEPATIFVQGSESPYAAQISLNSAGKVLAIVGRGDPRVELAAAAAVANGGRLYLSGLELRAPGSGGVACTSHASVWLDDVDLVSAGIGVDAAHCDVWVRSSSLHHNPGGALRMREGSELSLQSSGLAANGTQAELTPALRLEGSFAEVVHASIVANRGVSPGGLSCDAASGGHVRGSIVAGLVLPALQCEAVTIQDSVVDLANPPGSGNVFSPFDVSRFADAAGGDVHLLAPQGPPSFEIAAWHVGDPMRDLDGERRVGIEGEVEPAGADRP